MIAGLLIGIPVGAIITVTAYVLAERVWTRWQR